VAGPEEEVNDPPVPNDHRRHMWLAELLVLVLAILLVGTVVAFATR
jgi:hypothetical protein